MSESIEEIQASYIDEVRAIAPQLEAWLEQRIAEEDEDTVLLRWATGLGGHPRFIEIYRRYYLKIEALNEAAREQLHDQADVLISQVEELAPDIAQIVIGLFFNPIGVDANEETV